ncbi:glycerol-3-phosphate phosphatase 1 [Xylona heveae TC161]|uniref:Glycerol-3-phosphate phosphatase 1 n=1 Tax=Xylona heveae (strain CBS 132557 / TC161) TaxID=1328760 RepID=A0A165JIL9_XYLHT|nr:glycerol-3-phosphate phosphatase 1 [Xylona heveae TC161]KZF26289.1 glycerol-3-phosphate phosphatase 1 [Xylona heveae TC161]
MVKRYTCKGLLFDMDGTIIDSTNAIVKHWHEMGKELGVDPNVILATSHGRRSIDVLKIYDPSMATPERVAQVEAQIPKRFGRDAEMIPGARNLIALLNEAGASWAIVTSGTRPLVQGWLDVLRIAQPKHVVVAEDVENGKPDPACYRLGRARLGLSAEAATLVIEDAPAGIRAGKAAGCQVVGLTTTHSAQQVREAGADWIIPDLRSITFLGQDKDTGDLHLEIKHFLLS